MYTRHSNAQQTYIFRLSSAWTHDYYRVGQQKVKLC